MTPLEYLESRPSVLSFFNPLKASVLKVRQFNTLSRLKKWYPLIQASFRREFSKVSEHKISYCIPGSRRTANCEPNGPRPWENRLLGNLQWSIASALSTSLPTASLPASSCPPPSRPSLGPSPSKANPSFPSPSRGAGGALKAASTRNQG